jgi:hypothetical protein
MFLTIYMVGYLAHVIWSVHFIYIKWPFYMKYPLYIKQVTIYMNVPTLYEKCSLYIQNRAKKDPLSAYKLPSRGTNLAVWLAPQIVCPFK